MSIPTDTIRVENVVASSKVGQELDLETLADDLSGASFDPDQFPGLVYRTQEPKTSILVFRSGKVVTTGAGSKDDVGEALSKFFSDLSSLELDVPDNPDFTVQNMVSSAAMGDSLNLNAITIGLGLENVEYEPEQFPGLVYRLDDPEVVLLMFGSGKIVITGATSHDNALQAFSNVRAELEELDLLG